MAKGGNDSDRWCFAPYEFYRYSYPQNTFVDLNSDGFGNMTSAEPDIEPISLPYGQLVPDNSVSNLPAIIGGSAAGLVVILILLGIAFKRRFWRSLRDKDEDDEHKVEDISMHTFEPEEEVEGQDKILVTEEMEEALVDVSITCVAEVGLETHPRPTFVTILSSDSEESGPGRDPGSDSEEPPVVSSPLQRAAAARGPQAFADEQPVTQTDQEYTQDDALAGEFSSSNNKYNHHSLVPPSPPSSIPLESPSAPSS